MLLTRLFLTLCFAIFLSSSVHAATVTAKSSKRRLVKIDEGAAAGFIKGAKVCIWNDAGKKVACGTVRRAKDNFAYLRVKSKKRLKRIKKGMEVKLYKAPGSDPTESIASKKNGGTDHRYNVKLGYVFTALTPSTYNKLTYSPVSGSTAQDSLWKSEGAASSSLFGFALDGEMGVGESMAVAFGLRYRLNRDFLAQSDYNDVKTQYVDIKQTGSAIGLYSDFTFLDLDIGTTFFGALVQG